MKLYRLSMMNQRDRHQGYSFHTSMRAAATARAEWLKKEAAAAPDATIKLIEVHPTRMGIVDALNHFAGHADNG